MAEYPLLKKHLDDLAQLPRARRRIVIATILFIVYHLAATLAWGGGERTRALFRPLFFGYSGVLKATQSWGMFATIDKEEGLVVRGIRKNGDSVVLSPPEDGWRFQDFVERRERKFLSHLAKGGPWGQYGPRYLKAFCGDSPEFERVELWITLGRPSHPSPAERKQVADCAKTGRSK